MDMFARFDENPAMTSRYKGNKTLQTDGRTDTQRENSIPTTNKVCGGYNKRAIVALNCSPGLCVPEGNDLYHLVEGN